MLKVIDHTAPHLYCFQLMFLPLPYFYALLSSYAYCNLCLPFLQFIYFQVSFFLKVETGRQAGQIHHLVDCKYAGPLWNLYVSF